MPQCALCYEDRDLLNSHIVPKFAFDYLKRTSPSGYLRFTKNPNKREQDGPTHPMLCADCEQRFGSYESWFASQVFTPFNDDPSAIIPVDGRLLKFACSLSWRVALYYATTTPSTHLSPEQLAQSEEAMQVWREYLLDKRPHPGRFEQHILMLDRLASATIPDLPGNTNRYILRTVDMDIVAGAKTCFVYVKLPRIVIIGSVVMSGPRNQWQGTRIPTQSWSIRPRNCVVPGALATFISGKARLMARSQASMSDRQKQKVEGALMRDIERFRSSGAFAAMESDVQMFGDAAFHPHRDDEE
jgi:hypothetical protein